MNKHHLGPIMNNSSLASSLEHTLLGDGIDEARVVAHINEAINLGVLGVCLPLAFVPLAKKKLAGTDKILVTVIDFPRGQKSLHEKVEEARAAKIFGADEIDMVLDYQALINRNYEKVLEEMIAVVDAVSPLPIKVIVETSALNREELAIACALVALSKARFIKTSTGFHDKGAQLEDVKLMRALLPPRVLIKASGGIRNKEAAVAFLEAGASRIGTSKSKEILQG